MENYKKMPAMLAVSFIVMYTVMFLNVDEAGHIYLSITRFYMALLMVAPMAVLMLLFMPMMYKNRKMNILITVLSASIFSLSLYCLREQVFISDIQYMKAMIPHHSSAILTSKNAGIRDAEVKQLSLQIIEAQKKEIRQMQAIIDRLENEK
ncbi:DUF305 domain-containing protein [Flavobacterium sp. MFBS3-15]|mgnify:CR=1 FL=1|uniref:DUF305 domain-containing protein n=1 Tax=Flavobacterium sp. MFBS3-15 TaxID=2989816 RepID=UPI002235F1C4|nr:DUF305 domain-containing protein [Flavobacterium sp. MFBS3-15]MCW4468891.1 DUF305 domain-containing protein [Flavobacterium sp. MFBS3-15]